MFAYYYSRDGRAFLRRQTLILAAAAVALCALFGNGRFDLASAGWFYDDGLHAFQLTNHWLLKDILHDAARSVSAAAALTLFGLTATAWVVPPRARVRRYREELSFAAAALLAAAVSVGALKHFSTHACPWDLSWFGGTAPYHSLFVAPATGRAVHGCSPAAHPLSGFAWLAVGFALYPRAPRRAKQWWSVAFALGALFGAVQVARGAHFPSHVLWSAWVTWAVNIGLLRASLWLPSASSAQRSTLRSDAAALR